LVVVEALLPPAVLFDNDVKSYRMLSEKAMRWGIGKVNNLMAWRSFHFFNFSEIARPDGHPCT
jgi:hypothetical protein